MSGLGIIAKRSMITSRQKILNYIIEQQSVTAEELSRVFRVTPANIRHHLSVLADQGSVTVAGYRPTSTRGRPAQIYCAILNNRQNNIEVLADVLLSELNKDPSDLLCEQLISKLASKMTSRFQVESSNPTRRLYSSIRILNQMNYRAHWEAHIENPHIIFDQCPYRSLIEHHPELCQLDKCILEVLLSAQVRQIEKNSLSLKGLPQCTFALSL